VDSRISATASRRHRCPLARLEQDRAARLEYQALIDAEVRLDGRKLYGYDRFNPATLQAFFERRRAFLLQ
jgi:hypothetical protein